MAKSSRRKKQDRAKTQARRAEQSRLRARTERARQTSERINRLFDPATPPEAVAGILAAEFPDSLAAGGMLQLRADSGAPAEEVAETARLVLAGDETETRAEMRTGTVAVAAWAAHLAGDEEAEQGYVRELFARADAEWKAHDDSTMRLEVIRSLVRRDHAGQACELIEPYLLEHPSDDLAVEIYGAALARAYDKDDAGEQERAALDRFADRSGFDALREAFEAFLDRSGNAESGDTGRNWKDHIRRQKDAFRAEYEKEYWSAADRDAFEALAFELVMAFPYGDDDQQTEASGTPATPLGAFADDPEAPADLAGRARVWHNHAHYGLWQVADPAPCPGLWCTELVSREEIRPLPAGDHGGRAAVVGMARTARASGRGLARY